MNPLTYMLHINFPSLLLIDCYVENKFQPFMESLL